MKQAAEILNVSAVTVHNWIKSGLIDRNLKEQDIRRLKADIEKGKVKRLSARANKTNSSKKIVPAELASISDFKDIFSALSNYNCIDEAVYNLALAFVGKEYSATDRKFRRNSMKLVFDDYNSSRFVADADFISSFSTQLSQTNGNSDSDILGFMYQLLLSEGFKSVRGSYYTPTSVIDEMIGEMGNFTSYMDPCCGTGAFLLRLMKLKNICADNIYGFDIDENAVFLAKINILCAAKDYDSVPNIVCTNSISLKKFPQVDAIVTNPPWGAVRNAEKSSESFSLFMFLALKCLKTGGELNFLLPQSVLNISVHSDIRRELCKQTTIVSIHDYGKIFSGVFTPVVSIYARKGLQKANKVKIVSTKGSYFISQDRFLNSKDVIFDIGINDENAEIIQKIYSVNHRTLCGNALWALGIVTGNNGKFLLRRKTKSSEPIIKGTDISPYKIDNCKFHIEYDPSQYQQVAPESFYRAPQKLIYRFIANNLSFAYDNQQRLTLNSANILIPQFDDIDIKIVMAFLNSKVFNFIYRLKFFTHKVLRGNLEQLPFPILTDRQSSELLRLTDEAIHGKALAIQEIDSLIYEIFGLNASEKKIISEFK